MPLRNPNAGARHSCVQWRHAALWACLLSPVVTFASAAAPIRLHAGELRTHLPALQAQRTAMESFEGRRLHLVQFNGPIRSAWVEQLKADGLQVVSYLPEYAYLVYGDWPSLQRLQTRSRASGTQVAWEGPWMPRYKAHPAVWAKAERMDGPPASRRLEVQLVADPVSNAVTLAGLAAAGGRTLAEPDALPGYVNRVLELEDSALQDLLARPDVVSVQPHVEPVLLDERQNMIVAGRLTGGQPDAGDYLAQLASWGFQAAQFNQSGLIVDIADDGVDRSPGAGVYGVISQDAYAGPVPARHFSLYVDGNRPIGADPPTGVSRFVLKSRWGTASTVDQGFGRAGHGQLNMSILGGMVPTSAPFATFPHADAGGLRHGLGVAPYVRMSNSVVFDPAYTEPPLASMLRAGHTAGVRITSNSWGAAVEGRYDLSAQTYDGLVRDARDDLAGLQQMIVVFAAGNSGPDVSTTGSPGTAKNVITVGASEGVLPMGAPDGCGRTDAEANDARDMTSFSSRGPTADGRNKPDLVAPGTHILGMTMVTATSSGNGVIEPIYRGERVCGAAPGNPFFPAGQVWYAESSGTSHAAPAVSGGAALLYQQMLNNPSYLATFRTPAGSAPPSPALTKAYLMNSARFLDGANANDRLPSAAQGMGLLNLGTAFDGTQRVIRDQAAADVFSDSGQVRGFAHTVTETGKPIRITLAWTDPPGPTTGASWVNNLDLVVVVNGVRYRGNVFAASGGLSIPGGSADRRNNVESVHLPPQPAGARVDVLIQGTNIAGDGVPGNADLTDQDFALVVYNATPQQGPLLVADAVLLPDGNQVLEPNECNAVQIPLTNYGNASASGFQASLSSATPGVVVTQPSASYGALGVGSTGLASPVFQVSTPASLACGSTVDLVHQLNLAGGPVTLRLPLMVGRPPGDYVFSAGGAASLPAGGTLVPNSREDEAVVPITIPEGFQATIYGVPLAGGSVVHASTNGYLHLGGPVASVYDNTPLPAGLGEQITLLPLWDDWDLRGSIPGSGIFTQLVGTAPQRQFVISWRGRHYDDFGIFAITTHFGIVIQEGGNGFEYRYVSTSINATANGASATIGVQRGPGGPFTEFSVNQPVITAGTTLVAAQPPAVCSPGPEMCVIDRLLRDGFE